MNPLHPFWDSARSNKLQASPVASQPFRVALEVAWNPIKVTLGNMPDGARENSTHPLGPTTLCELQQPEPHVSASSSRAFRKKTKNLRSRSKCHPLVSEKAKASCFETYLLWPRLRAIATQSVLLCDMEPLLRCVRLWILR
jgi:hypothetical protein